MWKILSPKIISSTSYNHCQEVETISWQFSSYDFGQSLQRMHAFIIYMNTAGDTLNLLLSSFIWRTLSCRFPESISEITPWLPISGKSDCFRSCSCMRAFKVSLGLPSISGIFWTSYDSIRLPRVSIKEAKGCDSFSSTSSINPSRIWTYLLYSFWSCGTEKIFWMPGQILAISSSWVFILFLLPCSPIIFFMSENISDINPRCVVMDRCNQTSFISSKKTVINKAKEKHCFNNHTQNDYIGPTLLKDRRPTFYPARWK